MIGITAIPALQKAWNYDSADPDHARYYGVSTATKLQYGVLYLGLALYLAVMTHETHGLIRPG